MTNQIVGLRRIKGDMKRRKPIVIPGDGDPCPRCGVPMQIREPDGIGDRQRRQRFFYTRWFCCMNKQCKTTLVMPATDKTAADKIGSDKSAGDVAWTRPAASSRRR